MFVTINETMEKLQLYKLTTDIFGFNSKYQYTVIEKNSIILFVKKDCYIGDIFLSFGHNSIELIECHGHWEPFYKYYKKL